MEGLDWCVVLCDVVVLCGALCCLVLCCLVLCCIVFCCVVLCCVVFCCGAVRCVVWCCVVLYCIVCCCVELCGVVFCVFMSVIAWLNQIQFQAILLISILPFLYFVINDNQFKNILIRYKFIKIMKFLIALYQIFYILWWSILFFTYLHTFN